MHMVGCVCAWNFGTKFFLRMGECESPRKFQFSEKWQNRNFSKKIQNFSRSRMTKWILPFESSHEI